MTSLKVGDKFPENVVFKWVPWTSPDAKVCGVPQDYKTSEKWANKKVALVSVPGAFTPSCQESHIPPYIEKLDELRAKGVDIVAVVAFNDAWVMSAWGKVNGVQNDDILFLADTETQFGKQIGWDLGDTGRNDRWAMVIDHGKVVYAEKEKSPRDVTVSGVDAVLSKL